MAGDYARRIVARLSGLAPAAAAPLIAPRAIAAPKSDDAHPFEHAVATTTTDSTSSTRGSDTPAMPVTVNGPGEPLAPVRTTAPTAAPAPHVATPVVTHDVTTRSTVERERIVEHVVRERETAVVMPLASRDDTRARIPDGVERDQPRVDRDALRPVDEDSSREQPAVDRAALLHRAHPRVEQAPADVSRRATTPTAERRVPFRGPPRREAVAPIRPRPARYPSPVVPVIRERPRLVIGRLVVEVVPPPASVAPRVVTRAAAAPPRPFRADGASSPAPGRGFGLGQG